MIWLSLLEVVMVTVIASLSPNNGLWYVVVFFLPSFVVHIQLHAVSLRFSFLYLINLLH